LQVGHTSRRAIEAIAVKENIDSQKERRNGERRICMISTWSTEQVPFRRSRRRSRHFVTAAGFGFLIASNPEKKHLATIATNTRDQSDAFVIAMCLLLNRLWDPTHESR
jgi:hypothetical protein